MSALKLSAAIVSLFSLSACGNEDYRRADGKILCDPSSGDAYIVEHRAMAISKVSPAPNAGALCQDE